jgi:hypothetical protein
MLAWIIGREVRVNVGGRGGDAHNVLYAGVKRSEVECRFVSKVRRLVM